MSNPSYVKLRGLLRKPDFLSKIGVRGAIASLALPPGSDAPGREEDVVSGAAKRKMWRGLTNWPLGEISTSYIDQKGH